MHAYMKTYMHTYMHPSIHPSVHTRIHAYDVHKCQLPLREDVGGRAKYDKALVSEAQAEYMKKKKQQTEDVAKTFFEAGVQTAKKPKTKTKKDWCA